VAKIRVVLADDHQAVIERVRETLDENFEVVDTVENGQQSTQPPIPRLELTIGGSPSGASG